MCFLIDFYLCANLRSKQKTCRDVRKMNAKCILLIIELKIYGTGEWGPTHNVFKLYLCSTFGFLKIKIENSNLASQGLLNNSVQKIKIGCPGFPDLGATHQIPNHCSRAARVGDWRTDVGPSLSGLIGCDPIIVHTAVGEDCYLIQE